MSNSASSAHAGSDSKADANAAKLARKKEKKAKKKQEEKTKEKKTEKLSETTRALAFKNSHPGVACPERMSREQFKSFTKKHGPGIST